MEVARHKLVQQKRVNGVHRVLRMRVTRPLSLAAMAEMAVAAGARLALPLLLGLLGLLRGLCVFALMRCDLFDRGDDLLPTRSVQTARGH